MGEPREQQARLLGALEHEGEGYRLWRAGDDAAARAALAEAAVCYRRSWEAAPSRAFGRLVGMLKMAVLAGDPVPAAAYARRELGGAADSPTSWYALGLAALVEGEDAVAMRAAAGMREGSGAFERTAAAMEALAAGDRDGYRR